MKTSAINNNVLPAGTYWIADPCYILSDEQYQEWLESLSGCNMSDEWRTTTPQGDFIVLNTVHGDGCYPSNVDREFGVDAGCIAAIPVALVPEHEGTKEYQHTFTEDFTCTRDARGTLHFGKVEIYTDEDPT